MMAEKKKTVILIDQDKIATLSKLKELGYDTANKIKTFDPRDMYKKGLRDEKGIIFDLQDAIKANHSEIAWLLGGEDPKPVKKEEVRDEYNITGTDNGNEGYSYSDHRA